MAESRICPRCGHRVAGRTALCPRCLLREGLEAAAPPRVMGDYELIEEVARGGMGVVFRARQRSLNRVVAIKLILGGDFASEKSVQRFHTEAETVAKLQHPNIVTVHEVNEHEGQPYFSMDYVEGETLEDLARRSPMEPRRAARYIRAVAGAIHYAHQQGILHRDLKPSNILIDSFDQPRITDFGLARSLEPESSQTASGQILGSPNFMPPEQAAGDPQVSIRSDVYSLGAILYYLLTGRLLFPGRDIAAVLEQVKHAEPLAPRILGPDIPRDLETICLKCLEKEPRRRYPSAQAVAEELERFLDDKPILARPVSAVGRCWRWCRRNPALAGALTAVVVSLVGGILAAWVLAADARAKAVEAESAAQRAREAGDFIVRQVLSLLDPFEVSGAPPRPAEFLDAVYERLEGRFLDQPMTEASIRISLGETYLTFGKHDSARRELERALELQQADPPGDAALLVQTLTSLAWTYFNTGPIGRAEGLLEEAIEVGEAHLGPDHIHRLFAWNSLGSLYVMLGRYQDAEGVLTNLLTSYARWPHREDLREHSLYASGGLARALAYQGKLVRAERLLRERLETARELPSMGPNDPGTLNTYWMLAWVLGLGSDTDKRAEAITLLDECLQKQELVLGGEQQWCLRAQHEKGAILRRTGDLRQAERYLTNSFAVWVRNYGKSAPWTMDSFVELGWLRADQGRLSEARGHFQHGLQLAEAELGDKHPIALSAFHGLGVVALKDGQFKEAETLLLEAAQGKLDVHGPTYPGTVDAVRDLVALFEARGNSAEADRWRTRLPPDRLEPPAQAPSRAGE